MRIIPDSNGEDAQVGAFEEVNHCHGPGTGHPCVGGGTAREFKSLYGTDRATLVDAAAEYAYTGLGRTALATFTRNGGVVESPAHYNRLVKELVDVEGHEGQLLPESKLVRSLRSWIEDQGVARAFRPPKPASLPLGKRVRKFMGLAEVKG